jgi:phenylacetate-CoA ligase
MRSQISKAFSAPVFDTYGSHEFNLIAWECKETGEYHTCDDGIILEVLKDGRPAAKDERGEVVGTNLHSLAMPFIRYRLGDIVTKGFEVCRCGQPFSTIRTIQGRMIDYFHLPRGRIIHPYEITQILKRDADSWIRQHQLIQEREDRIILQVVPSFTPSPQEILKLKESVNTLLGQGVEFQIILVSEIEIDQIGKFRVSRSLVQSAYDGIEWEL